MPARGVHATADVGPVHMVQLYERDADLCGEAASYIAGAVEAGDVAIVIATEEHRQACTAGLALLGLDVNDALRRGRVLVFDAATSLSAFATEGRIDADAFAVAIGSIVCEQVEAGHRVRVFGEMVSLLWEAGHVMAALELEELWNELHRRMPFSLMCAYGADSVSGSDHADDLERMCRLHSSVLAGPTCRDGEGRMLPGANVSAQFTADIGAPRAARHLVVDAMRRWGFRAEILDDAALVVTELAANAVVHAKSAFSVALRGGGPARADFRVGFPADRSGTAGRAARTRDRVGRLPVAELGDAGLG